MATAGILAGAAAVSVAFVVGTRKLYKAIIADKDVTLPSLGRLNHSLRESAYPDDFYPDLYSRGYSVGPPVDHNPSLYVTQLTELLEHVGWRKCNLVGYSLPSDLPWVAKIFLLPYSAEILSKDPIKNYFSKKNVESMLSEFKGDVPYCIKQATEIMRLQFASHQGYPRGLMSTLKVFPLTGLDREFSTCQLHSYPVQAIWGTKDTVIPGTSITKLQKLVPRIKVTNVEGATHSIVMTHPTEIIDKLKDFVR
ncbi:hypothetical protein BGZ80_007928 [Entomortierella chlamydospora]|uniref:Uncharacterized protein n=1 Tax=Entomortierella chlamydospora TaxID=101097 RepID=A0A9P6T1I5_9FUNG|nr:hypothetical protein BGZ80_007928 [Entomortierella chlamydospora]